MTAERQKLESQAAERRTVERQGYRGYISTRRVAGSRIPQHVQNLVVRDYAERHGLAYRLSAVEYIMPGCYLMLEQVLSELPALEGIILYSLDLLPEDAARRRGVFRSVLESGASLHAAVEGLALCTEEDAESFETLLQVRLALSHAWRPEVSA